MWNKIEACLGGTYKSVPGGGDITEACPGLILGTFAIFIVIYRGIWLNNGIAQRCMVK